MIGADSADSALAAVAIQVDAGGTSAVDLATYSQPQNVRSPHTGSTHEDQGDVQGAGARFLDLVGHETVEGLDVRERLAELAEYLGTWKVELVEVALVERCAASNAELNVE